MSTEPKVSGWSKFYVPEVHDVHPGMQDRLADLLGVWPEAAQRVAALLVVPRWMDREDIGADRDFCRRIAALPGSKVLHGWTHSLGPDLLNWLLYGHENRSEFAALDWKEAAMRIAAGLDSLGSNLGVSPRWFCAPRWQQSKAATQALRAAGVAGYMLRNRLQLFSGEAASLPSLCFDEGDRKLRSAVLRGLRETTISRLLASGRPFRFTLHPSDLDDSKTWDQVRRLAARLQAEGWRPLGPDETVQLAAVAQRHTPAAAA